MRSPIALAISTVVLASCTFSTGSSVEETGVELIEGDLAEQSGLVYLDAACVEPASEEVGEAFTCTAITDDGAAVEFIGVIDSDDQIFLAPSNLIQAEEMSIVEAQAAESLGEVIGVAIDPSAVDCPDVSTVLVDDKMECVITDEETGNRFVMIVTAIDFVIREGFGSVTFSIGEQID